MNPKQWNPLIVEYEASFLLTGCESVLSHHTKSIKLSNRHTSALLLLHIRMGSEVHSKLHDG